MKEFSGYHKGINLGGWLSQCISLTKTHFDTFIQESDIQNIKSLGLDHIRLPVDYDIIFTDDGTPKEEGFAYIDKCMDWCRKNSLKIVLDLHKTKGYMFDKQEVHDADLFFNDKLLQDFFVEIWKKLAERYKNNTDIMAFELLNEIEKREFEDNWNKIASRAITEIRKITQNAYIIVGGVVFNGVKSVKGINVPLDDKIVYNFHCYEPIIFTHQGAPWMEKMPVDFRMEYPVTEDELKASMKMLSAPHQEAFNSIENLTLETFFDDLFLEAVKKAEHDGVPLYCGEYGVIDRASPLSALNWVKHINKSFEKFEIGRALWTYKQRDFGLMDAHYDRVRSDIVKFL